MLQNILAIVILGLLTLASVGVLIGGLVKGNNKIWIPGLAGLLIFFLGTILMVRNTVTESVNYAKEFASSEKLEEAANESAKKLGEMAGDAISSGLEGLDSTLKEKPIVDLIKKGSGILSKGIVVVSEDLDSNFGKTVIIPDSSVAQEGLELGRATVQESAGEEKVELKLYVEFEKDMDEELQLTALDSDSLKHDVASFHVKGKEGEEKVYDCEFQESGPGWTGFCILSKASKKREE